MQSFCGWHWPTGNGHAAIWVIFLAGPASERAPLPVRVDCVAKALVHRGGGSTAAIPIRLRHAVQVQCRSSPPHPRARYRLRNWPAYEAGLKRRGDLTLWIDEAVLDRWQAPRRSTPGGQAIYSDLAFEMVLMLRMVFHLALRQVEAFAGSVLRLLGLELCVPDHTTLSRRSGDLRGGTRM
jgi:hypothetical protein